MSQRTSTSLHFRKLLRPRLYKHEHLSYVYPKSGRKKNAPGPYYEATNFDLHNLFSSSSYCYCYSPHSLEMPENISLNLKFHFSICLCYCKRPKTLQITHKMTTTHFLNYLRKIQLNFVVFCFFSPYYR